MKREGGRTGSGERSRTVAALSASPDLVIPMRMIFGFYYRAQRTRLQEIVLTVGADGGRALRQSRSSCFGKPGSALSQKPLLRAEF